MNGAQQGKGGVVYIDTTAVGEVQKWTYSKKAATDKKFSKGDTNKKTAIGAIGGNGTIDVLLNAADAGQVLLVNGTAVTLHLYEGSKVAGHYQLTGSAIISGKDTESPVTGYETRTFQFVGVLTESVQTP